jgi:type VI secretion system protein ImpA
MNRMARKIAPLCGTVVMPGESDGAVFGDGPATFTGGGGGVAVNSRESAIKALDKVIDWFEANEPSNPVPFLLRRAQRCAGMNFFELISELANDRAQAELILSPHATSAGSGGEGG